MSLGRTLSRGMDSITFQRRSDIGRVNFNLFFDRQQVISRLDKKEQRVLGGTGSYSRGVMRRMFRSGGKKRKQSNPGEPPRYHTRGPFKSLKDGIFFVADLHIGSVKIGPNKLKTQVTPSGLPSSAALLDQGGRGTIVSYRHNKSNPDRSKQKRRVGRWKPRPYTKKSLAIGAVKFRELMERYEL